MSALHLAGQVFEVMADAGLLDTEAFWVTPEGDITGDRRHCGLSALHRKITLGLSQSVDVTRILSPYSRLSDNVVPSVVSNFSRTFSTKNSTADEMAEQSSHLSPVEQLSPLQCEALSDSEKRVDSFQAPSRYGGRREGAKRASGLLRVTTSSMHQGAPSPPSDRSCRTPQ